MYVSCGPGSSVGIATGYGLGGPGIESNRVLFDFFVFVVMQLVWKDNKWAVVKKKIPLGARFFAHVQTGPVAHPASYTMGTGSFPGVNRPARGADHLPHPSAEV
jgi:hypothetical protein